MPTYPLSEVAYPVGSNKPVSELTEKESTKYYVKYVEEGLNSLNI